MFIKFILDNKEVTYQELQEKFNNLEIGYDWDDENFKQPYYRQ